MEIKIVAAPEFLAAINALTQALGNASRAVSAPKAAETPAPAAAPPKPPKPPKAPPAPPPPAPAPAPAASGDDDFSLGGEGDGNADEAVSFDDMRALAMALSKKNAGAQSGMRTVFAKYKIQKLSELAEEQWVGFFGELKAVDEANP